MNHVVHIAATVQLRDDTEGRAYCRSKLAARKTPMEALRCLKRRFSDVIYRRLIADAQSSASQAHEQTGTGPEVVWRAAGLNQRFDIEGSQI